MKTVALDRRELIGTDAGLVFGGDFRRRRRRSTHGCPGCVSHLEILDCGHLLTLTRAPKVAAAIAAFTD
jgi:hypothetical protein